MQEKILAQGAEAIISLEENKILKNRIKKSYRIQEIDEKLRKQRTKSEAKIIEKISELINVPKILKVDEKNKEIEMQFIEGKKLSEHLDNLKNKNKIVEQIGQEIAKLHDSDIIHGDLTTSNMIYVEKEHENNASNNKKSQHYNVSELINDKKDNIISEQSEQKVGVGKESDIDFKVYFIDFGLSFHSHRIEDKAVDLHLLRQALEAKHFLYWQNLFNSVLRGYNSKDKEKILEQLKKVEARGRYKKGF